MFLLHYLYLKNWDWKESGEDPDENNLKNKCSELEKENNELKQKVIKSFGFLLLVDI